MFLVFLTKNLDKGMTKKYTLPAYVGIILKNDNQILLVQRHNTYWMSGYWNFPGGLLEDKETLIQAAAREIYEEINGYLFLVDFYSYFL